MKTPPEKPTLTAICGTDVKPRTDAEDYMRNLEIDILARTLWGEARGEPNLGLEAVASVVLNRVKVAQKHGGKYWWGGKYYPSVPKTLSIFLLESLRSILSKALEG